jgi:hypothetical protein
MMDSTQINIENDTMLSPTLQKTNSINTENKRNEWRSCCFILDRRCLLFLIQVIVTLSLMFFSMYRLVVADACSPDKQVFVSLLTMTVSIWIPSPKLSKKE